ncbi:MAG: hypothetical protein Q9166_006223 [cf. Caloplaca sp. 2 TL-2023]
MAPPTHVPRKTPKLEQSTEPDAKPAPSAQTTPVPSKSPAKTVEQDDISSLITSDMVTFFVGPKKKTYHVHRDLICSASSVLKGHFISMDTKHPVVNMYLPNHSPSVFELIVSFLYRGSFAETAPPTQKEASQVQFASMDDINASKVDQLLNLHFVARDWDLPVLLNLSIDHVRRYVMTSKQTFRPAQITAVYEKAKDPDDPLRRFMVDQFVFSVMRKTLPARVRQSYVRDRMAIENSAFLFDVIEAMINMKRYPGPVDPNTLGKCFYHRHPKGVKCSD